MESLLIFTLCLAGTYRALTTEGRVISEDERAQGFVCKSSDPNLGLMKAGERKMNYKANFCGEAICGSGGNLIETTCGVEKDRPECKIVADMSKPYPECCPKLVCTFYVDLTV